MIAVADRHLLFGLLALQNGLIDQVQLVAAFQAWTRDKAKSLADHLESRGDLDGAKRALLEELTKVHLEAHGGDIEKSLAVVPANRSTRAGLAQLGEPEIEDTLARLIRSKIGHAAAVDHDGDPDRTATLSMGSSTSENQRFQIVRPHARGGLGAVFVALDAELHREVALKQILDKHADNPDSRHRFLLEAEVTGGLEHPGIVPVYGLGTYANGRPYYAMRFIRGDSLKQAIDRFHRDESLKKDFGRQSLELRKLLRRFTDVCNAIGYAHSRGVLHRDIKPANIIVGKHGETLVVDWGLAKPLGHIEPGVDSGERTLVLSTASGSAETLPGSALGTPAYMSPEQAEGALDHLGPRSDVYSLGATLYYLLTGKPAFEADDIGDVLRNVQRGEFPCPRLVDSSIDVPLEACCVKAMARKPEDRYDTPRQLAEDVERWMADEPVSSYREPWTRTLTRWLSRHRTGVTAAAAAILVALVGTAAVLAVQSAANVRLSEALGRETTANKALAAANDELSHSKSAVQARYDLAVEAIKTFHTGVSEDFLLKQEQFKELRDRLLRSASDFYGKLGSLLGKETDMPSWRALLQANFELADLTARIGRKQDALAAHQQVLSAREALAAEPRAEAEAKVAVGISLTEVAGLLESTGKTDLALATYRRAESLLLELAATAPEAKPALAASRTKQGSLLSTTGKSADALAAYRLARADQEVLVATSGGTNEARRDLASTINRIAILLSQTGKPAESVDEYRKALPLYQKLADDNPGATEFRSGLAMIHNNLGHLLPSSEAEAEYRQALAIRHELAAQNPAVTDFRSRLADSHNNLGNLLYITGKPSQAEAEYRATRSLYRHLADDNPAVTEFRSRLAMCHINLGNLLAETGRPAEAEAECRQALAIQQKLAHDNPAVTVFRSHLAMSHNFLGILLSATGKSADAEAEYHKAIPLYQKLADDNAAVTVFRNDLAMSRSNLAILLSEMGKPADAEAEYRAAIPLYQKLVDDNPGATTFRKGLALTHQNFGHLLSGIGKPSEAEAEHRQALAMCQSLADGNTAVTEFRNGLAASHISLGVLFLNLGKPQGAEAEQRKALALYQKLAEDNPKAHQYRNGLASALTSLGDVVRRLGRAAESRDVCARAIAIRERLATENPTTPIYRSHLADSLRSHGLALRDLGDPGRAAADARRALGFYEGLSSRSGEQWFQTACCRAALSGMAGRDRSVVSDAEAEQEAAKAMALLNQAIGIGYRDVNAFLTESALDSLRDRPDFRLMMMDLAFPAQPFVRTP
jgi:eukaryotic-like serine/threonine-protein kinase